MQTPSIITTPLEQDALNVYAPIILLMVFGFLIVFLGSFVSKFIRPKKPSELKSTPYECGEEPVGIAWSAFNVRFYVVGLIFIIFDVESALMFPVATIYRKFNELGLGGLLLVEILLFLIILIVGIIYCWSKGDLDWVKSYNANTNPNSNIIKNSKTQGGVNR
jgi:NADH-quinone oxidoreductase subunit A